MARPFEITKPTPQIHVRSLDLTGWDVPPGWYGFVEAAGPGIARRAGIEQEEASSALERLGEPESESRSPEFDGRRLVRVDGGYLVLNFSKYREKDYTAAARAKRYRENKKKRHGVTPLHHAVTPRSVTQAEAEAEADTKGEGTAPPPPKPLNGADKVILDKEYGRVMDRMKLLRDSYSGHQSWKQADQEEFRKLMARRNELRGLLGVVI